MLETSHWPPCTWSLNALARDITVAAAVSAVAVADDSDLLPLHRPPPTQQLLEVLEQRPAQQQHL